MSNITVRVSTIGSDPQTVEVASDATPADALAAAGVDAQASGLNVSVDGGSSDSLENGSVVQAVPRSPKLGS